MRTLRQRTVVGLLATAAVVTATATATATAASAASPDKATSSSAQRAAAAPDAGTRTISRPATDAALSALQARVRAYVGAHGTTYTFGTYADPTTGRIVLDTDAPSAVVVSLTRATTSGRGAAAVVVHAVRTSDAYSRRDDVPAYYGGGGLLASGFLCSTGYAVKTSSGSRFMVTAGHCFANGTSVSTESGARTEGTVQNRLLASLGNGPIDVELLGGQSYAGRVFTGGVTSSSSIPVVSAGSATVGYTQYCHSGRTTGEQCGHTATSTTAQVCTTTGCKSPVIAYTGGVVQQGGDSGGAFYAKNSSGAYIRGHVIAGNSSTGYVEPFTQVTSRYAVSIVTG